MGQGKAYFIDHAEKIFNIGLSGKKVFFRFGAHSRIDLDPDPFDRISLTIKEHTETFSNTTFIYYGWEIIECLGQIYSEYSDAEFFVTYKTRERYKNVLLEDIVSRTKVQLDLEKVKLKIEKHYTEVKNFLIDKEVETLTSAEDLDFNPNRYSCFVKGIKDE